MFPAGESAVNHAVIFAHPKPDSFTAAVAETYAETVQELGHALIRRDLYRIGFDPVLKAAELPVAGGFRPEADVAAERAMLHDVDIFALVYPLWLNAPPAMMKGYLDRVFGFGFAYGENGHSFNPLLTGRKLISFSSSGAPLDWVQRTGALDAVSTLFDRYFCQLCGMHSIEHVHFGAVLPGAQESFVQARLQDVRQTVRKHFGNPP